MRDDESRAWTEDSEVEDEKSGSERLRQIVSNYVIPSIAGVLMVFLLVAIIFAILGVWPPFFNVISGSMEPNVPTGSLVVAKDVGKYESAPAIDTHRESNKESFGKTGDVVAYKPNGSETGPDSRVMVLHRVMFHVEEGENWYDKANPAYLPVGVTSCEELANCPAPHSGYITKGDANDMYDQVKGISTVVKSEWVHSEIIFIVPFLGHLRLLMVGLLLVTTMTLVFYLIYVIFMEIISSDNPTREEEL